MSAPSGPRLKDKAGLPPFDADEHRPARPLLGLSPRPKDASTLILVRERRQGLEVLMGQRGAGHVFMPDKWVFPGGRLEREDRSAPSASELTPDCERRLKLHGAKRPPRAYALTAVRETFEEAGLVVGRLGGGKGRPPALWRPYARFNAAPELHRLHFLARAITPPYRTRRFDARFFLARADEVLAFDEPVQAGEELLHVRWLPIADALALDLPSITRFILGETTDFLAGRQPGPAFVRWTRAGHRLDRLD